MDTSAFLAIMNVRDSQHESAAKIWKTLIENEETLVCSSYVLIETVALIQNRFGMNALKRFQDHIFSLLQIVWVTEPEYRSGMSVVLGSDRRKLSLVDCISFEIMRAYNIYRVFCFDPHFSEQGFEIQT